jgi:hypothetical protein
MLKVSDSRSRLTAVVPAYNGREPLDVVLPSLAARCYRSDWFRAQDVRTNVFILARREIERLRLSAVSDKPHGYLFESGPDSITSQGRFASPTLP